MTNPLININYEIPIEYPFVYQPPLAPDRVDPEKDAAVEATWTYQLGYAQWLRNQPARPLSTFELKKLYESSLKASETRNSFFFAIRLKAGDRLIGFLRIPWISWSTGVAPLQMFFGETVIWPPRPGSPRPDLALHLRRAQPAPRPCHDVLG